MNGVWDKFKANAGEYFSTEFFLDAAFVLLKIIAILVAARVVLRVSRFFISRLFVETPIKGVEYNPKRVQTLKSLANSVLRYTVSFLAITMILEEFQFPVASLLAGAGILGLAVGFGAQNLVKDVITGFFILAENQFSVGEHVRIESIEGVVEEIGLRTTRIKSFEGQMHIIPNGQINIVTNFTAVESIRILFDVAIPYEENVERVLQVLEQICTEFAQTNDKVVEGPKVLGVQALGEYAVLIRVLGRTVPGEQWAAERELKKKIKMVFDSEGIEFPYPKRVSFVQPLDTVGGLASKID